MKNIALAISLTIVGVVLSPFIYQIIYHNLYPNPIPNNIVVHYNKNGPIISEKISNEVSSYIFNEISKKLIKYEIITDIILVNDNEIEVITLQNYSGPLSAYGRTYRFEFKNEKWLLKSGLGVWCS